MATTWERVEGYTGLMFREHPTRRHGPLLDRLFAYRMQVGKTRRFETIGWASAGWTPKKAMLEMERLREAAKSGAGPASRAEKKAQADAQKQAEAEEAARLDRENVTLEAFFTTEYFPLQKEDHKSARGVQREEELFRLWIGPAIGNVRIKDLGEIHIQKVKRSMIEARRSPRTVEYAFAVIRQIVNLARQRGIYAGDSPTRLVKKPSKDNRRHRFLEEEEAALLLDALAEKSLQVRDIALLSLHTGLRAGEIFALTWADVAHDGLKVTDTKSGKNRVVPLNSTAREMLDARRPADAAPGGLVFPSEKGTKIGQVSQTFVKVAERLFNHGVDDPRDRVVFHTLRHTFASWLVRRGTPLIIVAKLMGHSTTAMTERYSHLAPGDLRAAVAGLETIRAAPAPAPAKKIVINFPKLA